MFAATLFCIAGTFGVVLLLQLPNNSKYEMGKVK